jgi:hypothetical protein
VVLSFNDKPATLVVPFDAIKTFADPSENFGLRFDAGEHEEGDEPPEPTGPGGDGPGEPKEERHPTPEGDAEVVRLDAFRKR